MRNSKFRRLTWTAKRKKLFIVLKNRLKYCLSDKQIRLIMKWIDSNQQYTFYSVNSVKQLLKTLNKFNISYNSCNVKAYIQTLIKQENIEYIESLFNKTNCPIILSFTSLPYLNKVSIFIVETHYSNGNSHHKKLCIIFFKHPTAKKKEVS